mgnify:CR=1 FL=1
MRVSAIGLDIVSLVGNMATELAQAQSAHTDLSAVGTCAARASATIPPNTIESLKRVAESMSYGWRTLAKAGGSSSGSPSGATK